METRNKIVDKLKKMYAHSKSAEAIGSEEEAQAFAAKIQELLSQHKIDLGEVEFQKLDEVDPVRRKLVDFWSAEIPVVKRRVAWQETLASIVCRANFCKFMVVVGSSNLYFCGRGTDLEASEQVFLYLVRVARSLADSSYVKYFYECRTAGDVRLARGFRASFLDGFTQRLDQRYEEERGRISQECASLGTALVRLTDAIKVVENWLAEKADTRKVYSVGSLREENEEGFKRGKEEADKLPIGRNPK